MLRIHPMAYEGQTYVIFDPINDQWAYWQMRRWKTDGNIEFDFDDTQDLMPFVYTPEDEAFVKRKLKERFKYASQIILLMGESTRNTFHYERWELEVALELDLPIIVVNLNSKNGIDPERCPTSIREKYFLHIPFDLPTIKYALNHFPNAYRSRGDSKSGPVLYGDINENPDRGNP